MIKVFDVLSWLPLLAVALWLLWRLWRRVEPYWLELRLRFALNCWQKGFALREQGRDLRAEFYFAAGNVVSPWIPDVESDESESGVGIGLEVPGEDLSKLSKFRM